MYFLRKKNWVLNITCKLVFILWALFRINFYTDRAPYTSRTWITEDYIKTIYLTPHISWSMQFNLINYCKLLWTYWAYIIYVCILYTYMYVYCIHIWIYMYPWNLFLIQIVEDNVVFLPRLLQWISLIVIHIVINPISVNLNKPCTLLVASVY